MNQKSLIQNYSLLKTLKEMSHAIYRAENNPMPFRMKWVLCETETEEFVLFCVKKTASLQLVRVNKQRGTGHTIAKFSVDEKPYQADTNKIYNDGNGFVFEGEKTSVNYIEPGKKVPVSLECLPIETVRSLLLDDGLEELEFQYRTLYNFGDTSFEMYCIFSLLQNVDDIHIPIADKTVNRLVFLDIIDDEYSTELLKSLEELSEKLSLDLENA